MVSNVELYDLNDLDCDLPNVCQRTEALVARGYLPTDATGDYGNRRLDRGRALRTGVRERLHSFLRASE
jgi:hypothetical protein